MRFSAGRFALPGVRRSTLAASVILAGLAAGMFFPRSSSRMFAPSAQAQVNFGERMVTGVVVDEASQPVVGATVFLQDQKTKTIRSFTTIANGHFSFAQVDKAQNFSLWAEKSGKKSDVKTVSSWDTRDTYVTSLKLK